MSRDDWYVQGVGICRRVGMSRGWVYPGGWVCPGIGYPPTSTHSLNMDTMGYGQKAGSTHPTRMLSCVN